MAPPLVGALEFLDQILNLQDEVYDVNKKEYREKYELKKKCEDKLRWDEKNACLRHPCIPPLQERLFHERSEIVESIPDFWPTALLSAYGVVEHMNEEEQKVFRYLRSVDVVYHGDAKSGYTIYLDMNINPYFDNLRLAKTFRFTREGTTSESGTEIRWMKDRYIEIFAEDEGMQSHNDIIVQELWPNARMYYLIGRERGAGKDDFPVDLSKLTTISDKLQTAEQQASKERWAMEEEQELVLVKGEREVHKECESLRRRIYDRRNEIIKNIPCFWLIAFSSHYALHNLLSQEDKKILRFLNSVNVEEIEDDEGVMSGGYTITLNFDENPYFENRSLTKTKSYTVMSDDRPMELSYGEEEEICTYHQISYSVCNIQWKDGMDMTTRKQRGFTDTDTGTSFFTWFSTEHPMEAGDEVADLIQQDFWPNAGEYFVNGNINDKGVVDLAGIQRTARFTSSGRAFFLHF
ncbi:hypothetical protein MKX03_031248 [Papaver bracteatum]|nr:hypothetical protein MKX03_031248 [Papaver bracteatum]